MRRRCGATERGGERPSASDIAQGGRPAPREGPPVAALSPPPAPSTPPIASGPSMASGPATPTAPAAWAPAASAPPDRMLELEAFATCSGVWWRDGLGLAGTPPCGISPRLCAGRWPACRRGCTSCRRPLHAAVPDGLVPVACGFEPLIHFAVRDRAKSLRRQPCVCGAGSAGGAGTLPGVFDVVVGIAGELFAGGRPPPSAPSGILKCGGSVRKGLGPRP